MMKKVQYIIISAFTLMMILSMRNVKPAIFTNEHHMTLIENGFIAFYSGRNGNNDIFRMNTDGTGLLQLTTHTTNDMCPSISHDGQKLYFTDGSHWLCVVKQDGTWNSPKHILPSIASEWDINIYSVTKSGSIYFIKRPEFDVYVSRVVNGNYKPPEKLCIEINSDDTRENSVFAAPDESYIIIEATKDKALCELFISFRMDDNFWSKRVKFPIKWGRFPSVSPDGKYLFFMTREGIYWVSTTIIDELRPTNKMI